MKELLSPAGNKESAISAINNGADAIYLGGKSFGARAYAGNFTNEELSEVIKYAHLHQVKVYVTVNTIIYNQEVEELIKYIKYLYIIGVDALIIQDIGMIFLIKKIFPNIELHASTQCHNHNNEGITLLKELGVTRVVLDREMPLEDIQNINVDIEKEVFIYGALCNCYSGCCLFSFLNGGRSGNRGECTQVCRLPYKLIKNDKYINNEAKYLLSTRELNTIPNFDKLLNSNIVSFKIEGRMKSPSYVGYVTKIYRSLIDNNTNKITKKEEENLKILFNRKFTNGYLFKDQVMNITSSNHQGLEIGKVLDITKNRIKIKLDKELYQEDGIRFKNSNKGMIANFIYNEKGLLVNKANPKDIIYLDNKINLKDKDILVKTSSNYLDKEILSTTERKIPISIEVKLIDNYLDITYSDNINKVNDKVLIDTPLTRSTTNEEIKTKLTKLGNTPFICNSINIDINKNIFVNMKELNNIRRTLSTKLIDIRTNINRNITINEYKLDYKKEDNYNIEISILARTKEQLQAGLDKNIDRIYVDQELYTKYKDNNKVYLRLKRVNNNYNYNSNNILATELGAIYKYSNTNLVSDYYLNVVNNYSIKYLLDKGVKRVTLSPEVDYNNLDDYLLDKVELIIYGTLEDMVTKSCPIKELNSCPCHKEDIYYLEDINKNKYRILHNNCLTHIMHCKKINYLDKLDYYKSIKVRSFRLELLDENYQEVINLIDKIRK